MGEVNYKQFLLIYGVVVVLGGLLVFPIETLEEHELSGTLLGLGFIITGASFLVPGYFTTE